ncbi:MAG: phosphoglycerate kinase, partial [Candidatus Dadabacteria bacterium]
VYVNDAFATAHRSHASMVGIPAVMNECAIGLLMQKELEYFEKALLRPKKPLCVVLGGAKVSTKLNALLNIADKADKLIIGGAMANTFLAAQGLQVGRSLFEPELFPTVLELLGKLTRRDCKLYLPVDVRVGPSPTSKGLAREVPALEIPADTMALDIGPATSILYKEALQSAETIVWNGPMGAFENEDYAQGTFEMIEHIASAHALSVVGGGDTDAAIHQMELEHKFDYISTGGGAFLMLLEGKELPALKALK